MHTPSIDEACVRQFKEGNQAAFKRIYDDRHDLLFDLAFSHTRNADDSSDIVSETFVKLWRNRENIDTYQHICGFLFTVAKNACTDYHREAAKKRRREKELLHLQSGVYSADQLLEQKVLDKMYEQIEKLPGKCKQVFKMIYFEGAETYEVAMRLSISRQNVLNQKARALQLLRNAMGVQSAACFILLLDMLWQQHALAA